MTSPAADALGPLSVPLWIPVTLLAAAMQAWRTSLQAKLKGILTPSGAGFVRFLYALPLEFVLFLLAIGLGGNGALPHGDLWFPAFCLGGGVAQILGTVMLVHAFHSRGFVAGTAYAKTEAAQLVLISTLFLGIHLHPVAIAGIFVAFFGVLVLSLENSGMHWRDFFQGAREPATRYGLGAATAFALSSLALRAASQHLEGSPSAVLTGLWVLFVTNTLQTVLQGAYLWSLQRGEFWKTLRLWRQVWPVGILSAIGSWAWFTGFSITHVVLVRGLGQIDTIFVFFLGRHFLKEKLNPKEIAAILAVTLGAILILFPDICRLER